MKGYVQLLKGTGANKYKMIFFDTIRKNLKSVQLGQLDTYLIQTIKIYKENKTKIWGNPMTCGSLRVGGFYGIKPPYQPKISRTQ